MEAKIVDYRQVLAKEAWPGIQRRTVLWGDQLMLLYNTFAPGAVMPEHQHPEEQITYVLAGELQMVVGGQPMLLAAGQSLLLPADVPHSLTTAVATTVLDMFAPPREAFK
jgi:quercetin dioxygenase-like cupin family protein